MGIPLSLLLFAFGAVLAFAVNADPSGLDLTAVGVIFMIVSCVGLAVTLYRDQWRRRLVEESIDHGTPPPVSLDDAILVDPTMQVEAPPHQDPIHPGAGATIATGHEAAAARGDRFRPLR
ncbi:hypothetical protein Ga0074812_11183 [Parafrankia irregularis]|uniref:Uncharacterized protein n=1 Tax=Parafrankia irregularis TaxID=795642 RepID=A0A0S4QQ52_9ACTN|nr:MULTISPECIES: hypothetical protein [Parafrankia]MBE3204276.1 hypothetical protein [Parafrankia sp. CH37]CUU57247.1 hypothetical protein Ga0074812_11183 [Parafrankia irregularis]